MNRQDAQASVGSAIKGSAWCIKAGLGHSVILGMEREQDGVSRGGTLNKKHISTQVDIIIVWLANDVRRVIEKACGIVADIDIMGH